MSSSNDSSYANPGIYRQSIEEMMYTPSRTTPKKVFHDETLASIKKVSALREKFENGTLDLTENSIEQHEEYEKFDNQENGEDVTDGPVHPVLFTPTPKPRTIRTPLRPDTQHPSHHPKNLAPEVSPVETPILRTMSRQFSGSSFIEARYKMTQPSVEKASDTQHFVAPSPNIRALLEKFEVPTHKTMKSSGSSSCSTDSSPPASNENGIAEPMECEKESFNTVNQFYYSKFARAQVHKKFEFYYQWQPETLRSCAISCADARFNALQTIPKCEQDDRVKHMKTIYENCRKGVNKEMDALCCALFDLLDDYSERRLSIHEDVVAKYNKNVVAKYNNVRCR